MSRARDRRKRREREAWAKRIEDRHRQARTRAMFPLVTCDECHGSGRALDWRERDAFGARDEAIGRFQMCLKRGNDSDKREGIRSDDEPRTSDT